MGMAKLRATEICNLKLNDTRDLLNVIGIKHCKNKENEYLKVHGKISKTNHDKNKLLKIICTEAWNSNEIKQHLMDYTSLTETYKMCKYLGHYGVVINFYESDKKYADTYSCREAISISSKEIFEKYLDTM